ncbi:MAG: hypothetical protein AAFX87_21410 [Bacteroidota bacterium]
MKIKITTLVDQHFLQVKQGFNQDLFLKLNPPFPPVKLLRFDGSKEGDKVVLELNFIFFKQTWESLITEDHLDDEQFFFVDKGIKLPFFLGAWEHRHILKNVNGKTAIVDDISFKTPSILFDYLMYPALFFQFLYRKPVYKKFFRKKAT